MLGCLFLLRRKRSLAVRGATGAGKAATTMGEPDKREFNGSSRSRKQARFAEFPRHQVTRWSISWRRLPGL